MSDLQQYLVPSGVVLPDTATLRAAVVAEWVAQFGADLVTTSDTPQGTLIDAETEARDAVLRLCAAEANQINPNLSEGVFLDAVCALTGLERIGATKTTVTATVTGIPGTLIPVGSIARTILQDDFISVSDVILSDAGTASVQFAADETGAIACGAGELTTVVSAVLGWETITNDSPGAVGVDQQSDQSLRLTRRQTLAKQGQSTPEAVLSGLFDLDDVTSAVFRENRTAATAVIDGITLTAKSIWACVQGATDDEVAGVILAKGPGGIDTNGTTSVDVIDAASGQTYAVRFDRPAAIPVLVEVTARNVGALSDPTASIKAAIANWATGGVDGLEGLMIGVDVSPWAVSSAIYQDAPGLAVTQVRLSFASPVSWVAVPLAIALDEIATVAPSSITVVVV